MRVLVTGGNGSIGSELIPFLLAHGHHVVALDRELKHLEAIVHPALTLASGAVEDAAAVRSAARGVDAIVHLAWSFSDDPAVLLDEDLRGHLHLLATARAERVRRFVYASTAVVYGSPVRVPIDEDHPLRVLEARKPAYGLAKEFAEKLTLLAARADGPPAAVLRFWWAFGASISGKHIRELLRTAAAGETVRVPADSGGSFLTMQDFNEAVALVLATSRPGGDVFNLASAYVTWEDVARIVVDVTGSARDIAVVPSSEWRGPAFLADRWQLDDRRIRDTLGFTPSADPAGVRAMLRDAIAATWRSVRSAA